jgi:hypothetical protein
MSVYRRKARKDQNGMPQRATAKSAVKSDGTLVAGSMVACFVSSVSGGCFVVGGRVEPEGARVWEFKSSSWDQLQPWHKRAVLSGPILCRLAGLSALLLEH